MELKNILKIILCISLVTIDLNSQGEIFALSASISMGEFHLNSVFWECFVLKCHLLGGNSVAT